MRTAIWALAALVTLGCTRPAPPPADAAAELLAPVPAPDGLLGAATAATPDATWRKLQRMTGGAAALLPPTFGGVLCAVAGLDPAVAAEIDGASAAFATFSGAAADPAWVVAARLSSARHARGVMFEGEVARYGAREAEGLTWVVARGGSLPGPAAVTSNGWLLVAKDDASLRKLANYTYRTLPARVAPAASASGNGPDAAAGGGTEAVSLDVPGSAFAELVPALRAAWTAKKVELGEQDRAMREKSGRAPDFGDPAEIVAHADAFVSARIEELGDVSSGHMALEVGDASVFLAAELAPREGAGPFRRRIEAMPAMGPEPLLGATADAEATLVFTDTERQKGEDLTRILEAGSVAMGTRLVEADRRRLSAMAGDWKAGRGKVVTMSALRLPSKGILVTTRPEDRDALVRALRGVGDVLRIANLQAALRLRDVATVEKDEPRLGRVQATTGRVPAPADPARKAKPQDRTIGLAWAEVGGEVSVVVGEDPAKLLAAHGTKERRLGDDDAIRLPIERVARDCSVALALQPFKLDPSRLGASPAPVVLAWGKRGDRAVLRTEISGAALNAFARRQLGL